MPSSSSNSSPQTGGVVSPYLLVLIPNTRLMSLAWSWWFIIYLCTSYFVLQITGLFYYVKVIILCSCCTPRPTALRSCALGADCLHQSLMPQSVVTHSGKALWRVWVGMATSMYVTFFHACTFMHLSLERIFKKCVCTVVKCRENWKVQHITENLQDQQKTSSNSRLPQNQGKDLSCSQCEYVCQCHLRYLFEWTFCVCVLPQCFVPRWGGSPAAAQLRTIQLGGDEEKWVTAPPRGQWVKIMSRNWQNLI